MLSEDLAVWIQEEPALLERVRQFIEQDKRDRSFILGPWLTDALFGIGTSYRESDPVREALQRGRDRLLGTYTRDDFQGLLLDEWHEIARSLERPVCQCEHQRHFEGGLHAYLSEHVLAGDRRAQHVGPICDPCAEKCMKDYLI
jgi:hypothetical protein